jgi:hypothetical protein
MLLERQLPSMDSPRDVATTSSEASLPQMRRCDEAPPTSHGGPATPTPSLLQSCVDRSLYMKLLRGALPQQLLVLCLMLELQRPSLVDL